MFHDSHLDLEKWFNAIALMCNAKKGCEATQELLEGIVEADETPRRRSLRRTQQARAVAGQTTSIRHSEARRKSAYLSHARTDHEKVRGQD
jgi:hypothetical protein